MSLFTSWWWGTESSSSPVHQNHEDRRIPAPAPTSNAPPPTFEHPGGTQDLDDASIFSFMCHVGSLNVISIMICLASYQVAIYSEDIYNDATLTIISWLCFAGIFLNVLSLAWVMRIYFLRFKITVWFYFRQTIAGISYLYEILVLRTIATAIRRTKAFYDSVIKEAGGFVGKIAGTDAPQRSDNPASENDVEKKLNTEQSNIQQQYKRSHDNIEKHWCIGKAVAFVMLAGSIVLLVVANVKRQQQK